MVLNSRLTLVFLLLGSAVLVAGCSSSEQSEDGYTSYSKLESASSETEAEASAENAQNAPSSAQGADETAEPVEDQSPAVATNGASQNAGDSEQSAAVAGRSEDPDRRSAQSPTASESPEQSDSQTQPQQAADPPSGSDGAGAGAETGPREVRVLVPDREFQVEGPDGALRITYDDIDLLKVLNMDPVTPDAPELMPDWLASLDQQRVRVRGFMYPTFQETGLTGFVLARDNQICCFGRDPKIYDLIRIRLRDGVTTNYIQGRPFDVVGTFRIQPEVDDGDLYRLYAIEDAEVIVQ